MAAVRLNLTTLLPPQTLAFGATKSTRPAACATPSGPIPVTAAVVAAIPVTAAVVAAIPVTAVVAAIPVTAAQPKPTVATAGRA
jgi:hypothetical protein